MKIVKTIAGSVVASLLLAACGNATSGMAFKPPSGYQSKINMFGMEMWTQGDAPKNSMFILATIPKKFDPTKMNDFNVDTMPASVKTSKVTDHEKIRMCGGNQAAIKVRAEGSGQGDATATGAKDKATAKASDIDMEMILTGWGDKTYMVMYAYPHGSTADPASEAALLTVCPSAS